MTKQSEKDRQYWERHARKYGLSLRALGRPLPRMLELTGAAVAGRACVLEVAAGTGIVTDVLACAAKEVIATDYAASMVEILDERIRKSGHGNVRCEQADLYSLRFEPASFDAVVAANVLHLVPDLDGALAALRRVLKPGGRLVAPTFCHDETTLSSVVSRLLALSGFPGYRRFTARSLRQALEGAGVSVETAETLPGLIPIGYVQGTFVVP